MEFPDLGKHCSHPPCNKLDFLPVKCDACSKIFCHEHMKYAEHECPEGNARDVQVPVCPLCNTPVPSRRGEAPDIAVGAHIDRDCQSDPALTARKVYSHRCFLKGCKKKEPVPFICPSCQNNFCIYHRLSNDHNCVPKSARKMMSGSANSSQSSQSGGYAAIQGSMSEDEALARALALSMSESVGSPSISSFSNFVTPGPTQRPRRNNESNCNIS